MQSIFRQCMMSLALIVALIGTRHVAASTFTRISPLVRQAGQAGLLTPQALAGAFTGARTYMYPAEVEALKQPSNYWNAQALDKPIVYSSGLPYTRQEYLTSTKPDADKYALWTPTIEESGEKTIAQLTPEQRRQILDQVRGKVVDAARSLRHMSYNWPTSEFEGTRFGQQLLARRHDVLNLEDIALQLAEAGAKEGDAGLAGGAQALARASHAMRKGIVPMMSVVNQVQTGHVNTEPTPYPLTREQQARFNDVRPETLFGQSVDAQVQSLLRDLNYFMGKAEKKMGDLKIGSPIDKASFEREGGLTASYLNRVNALLSSLSNEQKDITAISRELKKYTRAETGWLYPEIAKEAEAGLNKAIESIERINAQLSPNSRDQNNEQRETFYKNLRVAQQTTQPTGWFSWLRGTK